MIENLTEAEWSALMSALESMEDIWDELRGRERERAALRRAIDKAAQLAPSNAWTPAHIAAMTEPA